MSDLHADLLINSGSRRSEQMLHEVQAALEHHNVIIDETHFISSKKPLEQQITAINLRKPRLLIVGGGDGTVSSVMDKLSRSNIELGIIPLGTTNNCARSLGLPLDIDGAIERIANAEAKPVDLGRISNDRFTNVAGIGLSAIIAKRVTGKTKKYFGRFAYGIVGAWALLTHKAFRVTLHDPDSELTIHLETHQLIIANGTYHAGRKIAADAQVNNRELVIFALGGRSRYSLLRRTLDFYVGRRKKIAHAYYMRGLDIEIHTDRRQPVELDGEPRQTTPLRARIDEQAVKVRF